MEHRKGIGSGGQDSNSNREGIGESQEAGYGSQAGNGFGGNPPFQDGYFSDGHVERGGTSYRQRHAGGILESQGEESVAGEAGLDRPLFSRAGSGGYVREGKFYSGGASTSRREQLATQGGQNETGSNQQSGKREDWQEALLSAVGRLPRNGS